MKKIILVVCAVVVVGGAAYYLYPRTPSIPTQQTSVNTTPVSTSTVTQTTSTNQCQSYVGTSTTLCVLAVSQGANTDSLSNSYTFTNQGENDSVSIHRICGPNGCTGSTILFNGHLLYQSQGSLSGLREVVVDPSNVYLIVSAGSQNIGLVLDANSNLSSTVIGSVGKGVSPSNVVPPQIEQILESSNG